MDDPRDEGVAGAIHLHGGPAIAVYCKQLWEKSGPLPEGAIAVTPGGDLDCKYIFHGVSACWKQYNKDDCAHALAVVEEICRTVLNKANSLDDAKRICMPAIGTGRNNMPKRKCAKIMVGTCMDWL